MAKINLLNKTHTFFLLIIILGFGFLYSYRILQVPTGLTVDESAFGYNAALLSRTGHDENGRFLPLFVLSINGKDWRQPVTQYYLAFLFRIAGPSVFLLRFSSVIIALISALLIYLLSLELIESPSRLISPLIFLITPIVVIQSHLGLDNIMTIPFTVLWLLFFYRYLRLRRPVDLIAAAIFLGISFYTYKGMRATTPIWFILTFVYLLTVIKKFRPILVFSLGFAPFMLIIPLIQHYYPGAILGGARPNLTSIYDFFYSYLSTYDPTFLFIKGDNLLFHSTQIHGMFLISTLLLFIPGLFASIYNRKFTLILLAFFTAPLLFGLVDTSHRASRIMCIIPLYSLICTVGLNELGRRLRKFYFPTVFILLILIFFNFIDFLNYYWYSYPKLTQNIFGDLTPFHSYAKFSQQSSLLNRQPYLDQDIKENFFQTIYFSHPPLPYDDGQLLPPNSILMTHRQNIPGLTVLNNLNLPYYYLHLTNP